MVDSAPPPPTPNGPSYANAQIYTRGFGNPFSQEIAITDHFIVKISGNIRQQIHSRLNTRSAS
jgi:hypothetical protein